MKNEEAFGWLEYIRSVLINKKEMLKGSEFDEAILTAKRVLKNTSWIPVSDKLPDKEETVLVTVCFDGVTGGSKKTYYVDIAKFICGSWSSYSDEYKICKDRHNVIAWMPLQPCFEPQEGEGKK